MAGKILLPGGSFYNAGALEHMLSAVQRMSAQGKIRANIPMLLEVFEAVAPQPQAEALSAFIFGVLLMLEVSTQTDLVELREEILTNGGAG